MSNEPLPPLIAIVGPTASGKTSLSVELARRFDGEIVSADSRQIYRGMNIGTAKATPEERSAVPHRLIDIKDPDEDYTVADYRRDAMIAANGVLARGHIPFLTGGTGLYVRAVIENLDIPPVSSDPVLRATIEKEVAAEGLDAVFRKLVARDPEAEYIVDPKNPRRVVRALEVAILTGEPFTAQRKRTAPAFRVLEMGIDTPPDILRPRIDARIDQMMADGLVDEVRTLVARYGARIPAFDAIGYREIIAHLEGRSSLEEAVALMKMNTWHYAKRQMTWFRKDKDIAWIKDKEHAISLVEGFLEDARRGTAG